MKNLVGHFFKAVLFVVVVASLASCGGADDRKEVYIDKAKKHIKNNNYDKARIEIKNALQIDPKNAETYYLLGEIKYSKMDLNSAIGAYKQAIELDPNYNEAKIALAKSYSVTNYDEYLKNAEGLLDEVKKSNGYNEKAGVVSATILIKRHKNKDAEALLKNIITKNAKYTNAYNTLGYLYISEKRYDDAIELFIKGVNSKPKSIELLLSLADVLIKGSRLDEAELYIKRIIRMKPDVYSYQVALATLYVSGDKLDKAEKVLRDALNEDQDDVLRVVTMINFLAQKRSMKQAINELEKIVKSYDTNVEYKFLLSNYYIKVGMSGNAIALLEKIEREEPLSPQALKAKVSMAEIYYSQNDLSKSEDILDAVLKEHRNNHNALLLKSRIDIKNNKLDNAINSLRLVIKEQPGHKDAPMLLVETLKKQGNLDLAYSTMQQIIDAAPGNYQAYIDFTNFLIVNKELNRALEIIDQASNLFKSNFGVLKQKFKILIALSKKDEIVPLLDYMKSVLPARYEVYQLSGIYFTKTGKHDLAIKNLKLALPMTKEPYFIYRDILRVYLLAKKIDQLYAYLESEISSDANNVAALQTLADLYFTDKKFAQSKKTYLKALSINPKWVYAYEGLIKLAVANKDNEQAIRYFKESINVSDNNTEIKFQLLRFYVSVSKFSEADDLYKELIDDLPGNTMLVNNYISFILDHMNDVVHIERADELIGSIKNHPNASIQDTVAWYYVNKKQYDNAISIYKNMFNEKTSSAHLKYHYGYALLMSGDKEKAKPLLKAALKSDAGFEGKDQIQNILNKI